MGEFGGSKRSRTYFEIQRTAALLRRTADAALLEAADVTAAQAALLAIIDSLGSAKQRQLAEQLDQRESAITQMVAKLESNGLVARTTSPRDRRVREVVCTQRGRRVREKATRAFEAINVALDNAIGDSEEEFLELLKKIRIRCAEE